MSAYIIKVLTVTDLHRRRKLLELLSEAVARHQPNVVAFVGDLLHSFGFFGNFRRLSVGDCALKVAALPSQEIVFTRGNHEDAHWLQFAEAWQTSLRPLRTLHGEVFAYGPLSMLGFPCLLGREASFIGERPPLPANTDTWLPQVMATHGPAARALWFMHEPPSGTPLSAPFGPLSGNPEWVDAIERFHPLLCISGHDHHSPIARKQWHHRIGSTLCVNAGQTDNGPLHYCVVEAEFDTATPALPTRLTVTGFPYGETVKVMGD